MTFREFATLLLALAALLPAPARAALKVVTTTEGLGALAREVGGDRVEVVHLARGNQDPHFVDANPTLAVKLRQADLLVDVGLELEVGWLPPLVTQSRNAEIQPGGKRRLSAASAFTPLDVPTGPVDRSMGDLHPGGNPHFLSDPRRVRLVARAIAARLSALDPDGAAAYVARVVAFEQRITADEARWKAALAPYAGQKLIAKHKTLTYFLDWSGLAVVGYLEPKPGIEAPPSHVAELVQLAKADKVRAVVVETYYDARTAELVAKLAGARVVRIPGDVGASKGASTWEGYMGELVRLLAEGLAG
jgi:zinc/manganese transport system substrate-binding protein